MSLLPNPAVSAEANPCPQAHPGTEVHNMNLFANYRSLERLWTQVEGFRAEIERLIDNRTEEVHLLGN